MATTGLSAGFSETFEAIGLPTTTHSAVRRHVPKATSLRNLLWPSLLALSLSFLSELFVLQLTGSVHRFAVLWPVTGLQLGLLLSRGRLRWWHAGLFMLASGAGVILVGTVIGMPPLLGCEIAAFTVLDSLLGLRILRSRIRSYNNLKKRENLVRLGSAVFLVPLTSALLGAVPVATFLHTSVARAFCQAVVANSLGIALLLPATLWVLRRGERDWSRLRSIPGLVSLGAFSIIAVSVFFQHQMPTLFVVFPPMVLVTSMAGLEGAMVSSLLLTAIGWIATTHGHGPVCSIQGMSNDDQLLLLQIFLCTFLASALPIGALADARRRTARKDRAMQLALQSQMNQLDIALREKRVITKQLRASEARFRSFVEHSPAAAFIKDDEGRLRYYNRTLANTYGVSLDDWLGKTDYEIWPKEVADSLHTADIAVLGGFDGIELAERTPHPAGGATYWKSFKFPYIDIDGKRCLAGLAIDVTREKQLEEQLRESESKLRAANIELHRLTLEDPLTGLGNRRSFDVVLDQDLRRSQETGRPLSVLMLDVDHFKRLNDTYGHAQGDRVLRELGDLLRRTVRSGDRVCRYGGEEFAIMLPETRVEQALCLAERVCQVVREHAWTVCGVTVSVGVAASTGGPSDSISLAAAADRALYAAKRAGRNQALLSTAIAS